MTDPTLAALLDDPDPDARLVAADRAAELGDELLEAWLRWWALKEPRAVKVRVDGILVILFPDRGRAYGCAMCQGDDLPGSYHWLRNRKRWRWLYCAGDNTECWQKPPPALEAAVLAVLRARLAEVRHG